MVTIDVSQVSKVVNLGRKASLPDKVTGRCKYLTVCFWGSSGIGKTASQFQYRDAWEGKLRSASGDEGLAVGFDLHAMSLEDSLEFSGLPMPDRKTGRTRYMPQRRMPILDGDECHEITPEVGMMVLDDVDKTKPDTQPGLYPVLSDHMIQGQKLKPLWFTTACGNGRSCDQLAEDLPRPLLARMVHFYVRTSSRSVREYAERMCWNETVREALGVYGDGCLPKCPVFEDMAVKGVEDGTVDRPSPRQWEDYSRLLNVMDRDATDAERLYYADVRFQAVQGCIGLEFASREALRIGTKGQLPTVEQMCRHGGGLAIPDKRWWHLLPMAFALLAIPHDEIVKGNGGSRCLDYIKACLDAGVSRDIVRLGVVCLAQTWPSAWGGGWTVEFA